MRTISSMIRKLFVRPWQSVCVLWLFVAVVSLLCGCYGQQKRMDTPDGLQTDAPETDTIGFYETHHYTKGYNFIVTADTLRLLVQLPEEEISNMLTDSIVTHKDDRIVVADIRNIPNDSIDSVWVQVARDQFTMGWVRESKLLDSVQPDDPISQFIDMFSNSHLIVMLIVIGVIAIAYLIRRLLRMGAYIIHFNDIPTFYPVMLALLVASSAALYATIQHFEPEMWRHFYFHPTLNPFSVPHILGIFLMSLWLILILSIAVVDVVTKCLRGSDAVLYLAGLVAVCAADYIIFSITTLYYIGYILLALYFVYAIYNYLRHSHSRYVCGNCGAVMHEKGRCQKCGAENI